MAAIAVEFSSLAAICGHNALFAMNGEGMKWMETIGDLLEIFAQVNF